MISQIKEINFPEYATLSQATVTINDMGDRTITASVDIDGSIAPDFSYDWEVEFKGERYIQPLRQPQASKRDEYRRSKIDLVFYHWAIWQLKRYYFVEMTSTESGTAIADKYIASLGLNLRDFCVAFNKVLDYYFDGQITIQLNPDYNDVGGVQYVGISYSYIWDVLQSMYETYGVRWEIESLSNDKYVIKVGYAPAALSHVFQYGFEGGLLNIERQVQDTNIRNSLLGRGGEQNLPAYYFKEAPEGSLFASDPDAIPELENIYFSNLRGKTFRDYVKGWKARHYGGATMSNPTPEYLAGYNDSKFNPIEYVKDDASIAKYGLFQGALENNENIYPSIQGAEGEVNTVVYVEPILTDEINPEVEAAKTIQLPSMSESKTITAANEGSTVTFYLQSDNFTVPEGNNSYALTIANSATYNIYSWGALKYEGNPIVRVYETVYNTDTDYEADKDSLEPGTYYAKTIFQVTIPVSNFDTTAQQYAISRVVTVSTNLELRELQTNGSDTWTPTFDIWVKDIWNSVRKSGESDEQYADRVWKPILGDRQGNSAAVCFSSGWLARNDYDFIIVDYAFDDSKSYQGVSSEWRLTLAKSDAELEATGKYIPSASTNGQAYAGDTFYFIGIDMPYEYVLWAEEALDSYKYAELYKISEIQPKWVVKFDKIRIHEGDDPLVDKIVAGGLVSITDKRFSPDAALALYLTSVTYTWNDSTTMLPDIEVVLADRVTVVHNPVAQMQSSIELLQSQVGSMAAIPQLIRSICDRLYLRKDGLSDTSLSPTKFASIISGRNFSQGMVGGTDWGIYKDGNGRSVAEFDKLVVRNEMTVNNLVVNQVTAVGGTQIMSAAAMECSRVVETDDSYECFFEQKEGTVANMFAVNDIAYSQVFNPEGNSIKYYKRVVTAISENSITLSKTNADGSGIPMAGDNIVQFGNLTDVDRQSFIVIEPLNGGSIKVFAGVNSFTLDERNYVGLGVNPTTNRAYLYGYGDMFFGDRNLESNFITYQIPDPTPENPDPDPILVINADVQLGVGSTGLSNLSEYKDLQDQIANAGDVYYYEEDASLDNEPAATWIKEGKEADHLNAIYHNTKTGDSWRWVEESGVYKWKLNVNSLDYLKEAFPKNPAFMSNGLLLASMIGVWDENQNLVAGLYGGGSNELNQENGLWDAEHGAMLVFGGVSGLGTDEFNYKTAIFEDGFLKSTTFATATEGPRVEINDNRIHIHGKDETAKIEIGYDAETGQPVLQYIDQYGNHAWSAGATGISNAMTIDTDQVVTGSKDFVGGILVNGQPLVWDEDNLSWILPGNLIVTGGLATYSTFNNENVISVYDGLPIDGTTIYWSVDANGGKILKAATGGGTGGGIDESQLEDYLTSNGYATQSWVNNKGYALQSSLTAVDNRLKSVETFFATDDTDSYVNKWDEIVTFLNAVEGDTLDDILSTKFDKDNFTKTNIQSKLGISDWALAATKPSYTFSEITSKPTTLSGYGITNAYTKTEVEENFLGIDDIAVGAATLKQKATSKSYLVAAGNGFNVMNPYDSKAFWFGFGLPTGSDYATTNWRFGSSDGSGESTGNIHCGSVSIGGAKITYNSAKNAYVFPANVIIEGGLATYTKLSGFTNLDVMGGVVVDNETIAIVDGALKYIGSTGGGGSVSITGAASTIVSSNLAASRALISNSSGKVAVSAVTSTELGYLDGVTSAIQTQLNNKQATLVSGTNIKTINGTSILGSGNITISGGISNGITLWGQSFDGTSSVSGAIANTGSITPSATHTYNLGSSSRVYEKAYLRYIDTDSYDLRICCNGNERIHIAASNGYVGIGTTSPTNAQLQVEGDVEISEVLRMSYSGASAFPDAQFFLGSNARIGGTNNGTIGIYGRQIFLRPNSTTSASSLGVAIDISGNMSVTGAVTENSDRKLKDIEYEGDGLDLDVLKKVKVAKWHWKDKHDKRLHIGGVADNLAEVMPEVVFESQEEDGTTTSSIAYGKAGFSIAASLIAPVSRHEDRIKGLEKNIEKMQNELNKLKKSA